MKKWHYSDRIIAPSLLAADFGKVQEETTRAINAGADWMHLDVMDGHFVPNISFGPAMVNAIHETNDFYLDVHLMISHPDKYLPEFIKAGSDMITVHVEAEHDVAETLKSIRAAGCHAGLALNPATSMEQVKPYLHLIDLLLVMTVVPGFGGQSFMQDTMPKVTQAAEWREQGGHSYHIEVDGGIDAETAKIASEAGANVLVAGSSTFKAKSMTEAVSLLRDA